MRTITIELALMQHFDFRRSLIVSGVTVNSGLVDFETDLTTCTARCYEGVQLKKKNKWRKY